MADGIVVPEHVIAIARNGVYMNLESIPMIKEFDGTIDEAIDHFGMRGFVENDIGVISAERAYCHELNRILNEETFNGAYAHLANQAT